MNKLLRIYITILYVVGVLTLDGILITNLHKVNTSVILLGLLLFPVLVATHAVALQMAIEDLR